VVGGRFFILWNLEIINPKPTSHITTDPTGTITMMMKLCVGVLLLVTGAVAFAPPSSSSKVVLMNISTNRRSVLLASSLFGGFFGGNQNPASAAVKPTAPGSKGPTNEVVKVSSKGMKLRRLGGSDILVSELGLGTQRWASNDYNAPDEDTCWSFMVRKSRWCTLRRSATVLADSIYL
jgi:hypothetical protein